MNDEESNIRFIPIGYSKVKYLNKASLLLRISIDV